MTSEETVAKIHKFISDGGTFVNTFYSGLVNENDLAYESWSPYKLNDVFGIRVEETDALCDGEYNEFTYNGKTYKATYACDLLHADTAEVVSTYEKDFYRGMPIVTKHNFKNGTAVYIASRTDNDFLYDFYGDIIDDCKISRIVDSKYVEGVMIKERTDGDKSYKFVMNFNNTKTEISNIKLDGYEVKIIE